MKIGTICSEKVLFNVNTQKMIFSSKSDQQIFLFDLLNFSIKIIPLKNKLNDLYSINDKVIGTVTNA